MSNLYGNSVSFVNVKPVDLNTIYTTVSGNIQTIPNGTTNVTYANMAFGNSNFSMSSTNTIIFPSIGLWDIDLCAIINVSSGNANYTGSASSYMGVSIGQSNTGNYSACTVSIPSAISGTLGFTIPIRYKFYVTAMNSGLSIQMTNYSGQSQNWYMRGNITKQYGA